MTATTSEEDEPMAESPVTVRAHLDEPLSRWLWLVKWLLAIPHFIILIFLWIAFSVVTIIAFFAILFTAHWVWPSGGPAPPATPPRQPPDMSASGLLDRLQASAPARVVTVSSGAQPMGRIDFDDLQGERSYQGQHAYNQSSWPT